MEENFARILSVLMMLVWGASLLAIAGTLFVLFNASGMPPAEGLLFVVAFWGAMITFCLSSIYLRIDGRSDRP